MTDSADPAMLAELAKIARSLAIEAGNLIEAMRAQVDINSETKSSITDVVTEADRAAEDLIIAGLSKSRPGDAILGEEGTAREGSSDVRWLVDPIDGTTNYVYNIAAYSVSIAAEINGTSVVGVVLEPRTQRLYSAIRGGGAFLNKTRIHVGSGSELATALVGTGFGYQPEQRRRQGSVLASLLPAIRDIRRFGSAALDLCLVAEGQLDAYYETGLNPWDLAAGSLIAAEAGATVGNLRGGPPGSDFVLAANPTIFDLLTGPLRASNADFLA